MIKWAPFSDKHKQYIKSAFRADFCVAEGAIRSGKTIDHCIISADYLETCEDKIHLASGSTVGNAKLNIGECNGFGLEHLFAGRCKWTKFKENEALKIMTKTGEKIVIFAGGGKADSYKKILGNSYGLWIATEINEHYDSENSRESFIKVALGRQIAAVNPKTLWDLNPSHPADNIYTEYIDKYKEEFPGVYLYGHFTIADNLSISPERQAAIKAKYTPGTVWYDRDILGKRTVAEGLVYRYLADTPQDYIALEPYRYDMINIGVDFGGNKSKTTFVATGFDKYKALTVLACDSLPITEKINSDMIMQKFIDFTKHVQENYGRVFYVFGDSASPTMLNQMTTEARRQRLNVRIVGSDKSTILRRAQMIDSLLVMGRLKFRTNCQELINALASLQWDRRKEDAIEDKNINNCNDWFDAFCYSWSSFIENLERGY